LYRRNGGLSRKNRPALPAGNGAQNDERFFSGGHRRGYRQVGVGKGNILAAGEKAHIGAAL